MFKMQVNVQVGDNKEWRDVRPSDREEPYRYATREEAERMLYICYPYEPIDVARVVEEQCKARK